MRRLPGLILLALAARAQQPDLVFREKTRLVEIHVTVWDQSGRHVDGLTADRFEILDAGEPQRLVAFESSETQLSCAILLDTTGSMAQVLPAVKNSILRMIGAMREADSVAVFGFASSLNRLQDFTTDKDAAKRAILRTRAAGTTALFDALSEMGRDLSRRTGKKSIVVFTDGLDNASVLTGPTAMKRAKTAGIPVYSVAQGDALKSKQLMLQLKEISALTGAPAFAVRKPSEIEGVFGHISRDLLHSYMLTYKPPNRAQEWVPLQVRVRGAKGYRIRAREGYYTN